MTRPRSFLSSILANRCPACREARLFTVRNAYLPKTMNTMPKACPNCWADFEREPGFYFGAAYVSYALTVALWVAGHRPATWWTHPISLMLPTPKPAAAKVHPNCTRQQLPL